MENIRADILETQDCNSTLLQSCSLYEELYNLYQELEKNIVSSPTIIVQITERLNNIQQRSKAVDNDLEAQLSNETNLTTINKHLLTKRENVLRRLINQNRSLVKKAGNITSHLQHEMNSMNTNRNAINGYKTKDSGKKRIINSSF